MKSILNFVPEHGDSAIVAFNDMVHLREMKIADYRATITLNGCTCVAGIFETFEEFFEHYKAVVSGDKQSIMNTIPKSEEGLEALICANNYLYSNGYKIFSSEEMDDFRENMTRSR